jgi:pyruvate/2-oxoglutarate/acetoin dehydrogenase E1 component
VRLTYAEALDLALAQEMRRDPRVVIWGVDVGEYGGAFSVTKGLHAEFGSDRVIDMPISELGFTGMAVGAAATGLRPVVELQFSDWITLASDQLVNQAAKMRYMFGGLVSIPLVLRAPSGGYLRAASQHSDSFESMFAYVPGLKVVYPATPRDAHGLLRAAILDDNPVIFFEHKKLYGVRGEVPDEDEVIPLGRAEVKREGTDVTIATYALMVGHSLKVAEQLAADGISVEVVDLRTISPLDTETLIASVRKTHRLVVVHEAWLRFSVGSEIAALVAEEAYDALEAPIVRVAAKYAPIPFSPVLEDFVLPSMSDIENAVRSVLKFRRAAAATGGVNR